jgi:hypothetical protein
MNESMLSFQARDRRNAGSSRNDAEQIPDVTDEVLEASGTVSSVAASHLTTSQQNCCR